MHRDYGQVRETYAFSPLLFLFVRGWNGGSRFVLFTDDLDQNTLPALAVELAVKDLLPRAKVEPSVRDRHDDLAAHHAQLGELRPASGGRRRCPRRSGCGGSG
jgi:hypothetical protein